LNYANGKRIKEGSLLLVIDECQLMFNAREWIEKYMSHCECRSCRGKRLRPEALSVTVGNKNIWDLTELSVADTIEFFDNLKLTSTEQKICAQVLKEIKSRLQFLKNVGLEYLTLERSAATLSGGEAQRIRLSTQIGSGLTGVMYILAEPSIGLHQRDNERLIKSLTYLRDLGNTVIVVEHDEQTLRTADWLVDIGPALFCCLRPGKVRRLKKLICHFQKLLLCM